MAKIQDPLTIKSITFKNRIGMSPMCQYSSTDGFANDWHFVHYVTRAVGGAGLIMVEAAAVSPEGRITPYDLGLWSDEHIAEFKRINEFIHQQGAVSGIQIAHAGRKASHDAPSKGGKQLSKSNGGWDTIAPSEMPFESSDIPPIIMTTSDLNVLVEKFKLAAQRAVQADFKVIEIHAAHGYLIHEYLSPLSNNRTDEYGGSFENRIRLLLEVVEAVKSVWPSKYPLFVRLSVTDWVDEGWCIDESVELSRILCLNGVDLIDCSSGGNIATAKIPVAPGYQVSFSSVIKETGVLTAAVGMLTTKEQLKSILEEEKADMVFLARELLRNPYFAINEIDDVDWPVQYLRAK